jgi:hypothetical protein
MKLAPIVLLSFLIVTGCSQSSDIDGEYTIDVEYSAMRSAVAAQQSLPADFDITIEQLLPKAIEGHTNKKMMITIRHPEFMLTRTLQGDSTPTTTVHKLRKVTDTEYILIIDKESGEKEFPLHYDKSDGSLTGGSYKYIRR